MNEGHKATAHRYLSERIEPSFSSAPSIFNIMAYTVISLLVYAYAAHNLSTEEQPLRERCSELTNERNSLKKMNQELSEMAASLSDPAADEYALITELGRIPKGSYKIVFVTPGKKAT